MENYDYQREEFKFLDKYRTASIGLNHQLLNIGVHGINFRFMWQEKLILLFYSYSTHDVIKDNDELKVRWESFIASTPHQIFQFRIRQRHVQYS